MTPFLLET